MNDLLAMALERVKTSGGFSLRLNGTSPTRGYMVAPTKRTEYRCAPDDVGAVAGHLAKWTEVLAKHPSACWGGWVSGGRLCLDVSFPVRRLEAAVALGRLGQQEEVFDLSTFTSVPCSTEVEGSEQYYADYVAARWGVCPFAGAEEFSHR
jgi:hypothetical protein